MSAIEGVGDGAMSAGAEGATGGAVVTIANSAVGAIAVGEGSAGEGAIAAPEGSHPQHEQPARTLELNRVYRHFKGDYYLVQDVALHSETKEKYVVYRRLYGDGGLWIRPYDMFMSEVDRDKYPNAEQRYRFELQEIESVAQ